MPYDLEQFRQQNSAYQGSTLREIATDLFEFHRPSFEQAGIQSVDDWGQQYGLTNSWNKDEKNIARERHRADMDVERQNNMKNMNFFTRSVNRGIQQSQAMMYGLGGLAGSALGIESLKQKGLEGYQRNIEEAGLYPGTEFDEIGEAEGLGKVGVGAQWAVEKLGENLPILAGSILSGGVGGFAAGKIAPKALSMMLKGQVRRELARETLRAGKKQITDKAIKGLITKGMIKRAPKEALDLAQTEVLKTMGSRAGLMAGMGGFEAGGMFGDVAERGHDDRNAALKSLGFGMAAGAVELLGGVGPKMLNAVFGKKKAGLVARAIDHVKKSAGKGKIDSKTMRFLGRAFSGAADNAPQEFAQEWAQELLSLMNVASNDPTFEIFSEENLAQMWESGWGGAAVGGLMGGAMGPARYPKQAKEPPKTTDDEIAEGSQQFDKEAGAGTIPPPPAPTFEGVSDRRVAAEYDELNKEANKRFGGISEESRALLPNAVDQLDTAERVQYDALKKELKDRTEKKFPEKPVEPVKPVEKPPEKPIEAKPPEPVKPIEAKPPEKPAEVEKPEAVKAKEPERMVREEYLAKNMLVPAIRLANQTDNVITGKRGQTHLDVKFHAEDNLGMDARSSWEVGWVLPSGEWVDQRKALKYQKNKDSKRITEELSKDHKAAIKNALSEGKLTKEEYNKLHAEQYGSIEKFAPDLAKPEKPPKPEAIIKRVAKEVDEKGNLLMPGDRLNKLLKDEKTEDVIGLIKWAKQQSPHVNRFVGASASAELRSRKVPVDEIKWQQEKLGEKPSKPILIGTGESFKSKSGRELGPVPRVDATTNIRAKNTTKRINGWLKNEAIKEATANNDEFNRLQFENIDLKNVSQADQDALNLYLFGDHEGPTESQRVTKEKPAKPIDLSKYNLKRIKVKYKLNGKQKTGSAETAFAKVENLLDKYYKVAQCI